MNTITLSRSKSGLKVVLISTGVVGLALIAICTILFLIIFQNAPRTQGLFLFLTWVVLPALWAIQSLLLVYRWRSNRYETTPEAIIVEQKDNFFGSTKSIYRYESIVSLRVEQSYLGKRYGYGDIRLSIPKIEGDVVLKDIDNPTELLAEIQKHVATHGASAHSLIN